MASRIQPDQTPPTVTSFTPANGANAVNVGVKPTATFSEPMNAGTVTSSTFVLKGPGGASVAASVSYDGVVERGDVDAVRVRCSSACCTRPR